jgi:hypothetical protein
MVYVHAFKRGGGVFAAVPVFWLYVPMSARVEERIMQEEPWQLNNHLIVINLRPLVACALGDSGAADT